MLSDSFELDTPQKKEWPLIPADVYQIQLTNIEEKIEPYRFKEHATEPDEVKRINFEFAIIEDGPNYGRRLWQKMAPVKPYQPTGKGKETWMYRLASAFEGHPIQREEADLFGAANLNSYLNRQLRITVKHSAPNASGKQYANVDSFLPVKTMLPPFDEAKVPKENQAGPKPVAPMSVEQREALDSLADDNNPFMDPEPSELSGYDKAKAVAQSIPKF